MEKSASSENLSLACSLMTHHDSRFTVRVSGMGPYELHDCILETHLLTFNSKILFAITFFKEAIFLYI